MSYLTSSAVEKSIEKIKMDEEIENCGSEEITNENEKSLKLDDLTIKRICSSRCSICNSDHMLEIHDLRKAGAQYDDIVSQMRDRGFECSPASLSRHFKNLTNRRQELSAQIIQADLINDATKLAAHTRAVVELIDLTLERIKARFAAGTMNVDIKDLDALMKLRYQLLNGQNTENSDFMAIFQRATDKYGVNLAQATLFSTNVPHRAPEQEDDEQ